MKIETKFDIGQTLYAIVGNSNPELQIVWVEKIRAVVSNDKEECLNSYSCTNNYGYAISVFEEQLFATKEEAEAKLKDLLKGDK